MIEMFQGCFKVTPSGSCSYSHVMAQPGELAFTGKSECVRGAHRDLGVDQPGSLTDGYILEPTYCPGEDGRTGAE